MNETRRHQEAFEYYYMLQNERSLSKVADHFGVSRPTVTIWSQRFDWPQRIIERDNKNMATIREQNDKDVVSDMQSYRKIIRASVKDYIDRLKSGKIKIDSVKDFTQLVKLDMELCGYVDVLEKETKVDDDSNINVVVNISKEDDINET